MALQIRVVAPATLRESVLTAARDEPGVAEITLLEGASVVPPGDVITISVVRESVDGLLQTFHKLEIARVGSVTVTAPELVISQRLEAADKAVPGDGADAIIWDEVENDTSEDAKLTWSFLALLTIAVLLAGIGIVTDSTIAIVGAMVVGPEFGPLSALSLALVSRKWSLARRAIVTLLVAFPIAMALTAVAALVSRGWGLFDPADVLNADTATEFIYHPGPYSFIVAVLAGAAGMLSLIGRRSAALVGVFISVTTVPAAGYIAIAIVLDQADRAAGSLAQLVLNISGIIVSAVVVLLIYRLVRYIRPAPHRHSAEHVAKRVQQLGIRSPFRR
ncbi:DUF389 domain-containing protein [Arthrobacter sp. GMC3]|uniref:DUF389 domain-containing protein n=1 Tax=Arthrobacter sp. GMC3 TaxID=2058894 RepID=UPI000CE387C9|nr:DUF389 domain-containing protein [Arthrobacter sp. GMC3]